MKYTIASILAACTALVVLYSCSKDSDNGGGTTPDACAGITINVTGTATEATPGKSDATITAAANGGTKPFTFSLNNGAFQSSGTFSNLAKGTYTIVAKNADGCQGSSFFTVKESSVCTGTPGTKFTAVKNLLATKCTSCHGGTIPTAGLNLGDNCTIVLNKDKINNRAVIIGDMPQGGSLTTAEKQLITDWVNAGGKLTD